MRAPTTTSPSRSGWPSCSPACDRSCGGRPPSSSRPRACAWTWRRGRRGRASEELELSPKEFDLLALLVREAGRVVTRERIMAEVWDENWFGSTKTLDMHVSWLRRKLGDDADDPRLLDHGPRRRAPVRALRAVDAPSADPLDGADRAGRGDRARRAAGDRRRGAAAAGRDEPARARGRCGRRARSTTALERGAAGQRRRCCAGSSRPRIASRSRRAAGGGSRPGRRSPATTLHARAGAPLGGSGHRRGADRGARAPRVTARGC